jgi:hypothetical protein
MSGNITHGYDLVIEMSEDTLNLLLATMPPQQRSEDTERLGTVEFILNPPTAQFAAHLMLNGILLTFPAEIMLQQSGRSASANVSVTVSITSYTNLEGMIYPALDFRGCTVEIEDLDISGISDAEHRILSELASRVAQTMLQEQLGFYEIQIAIESDQFTIYALEVRIIDNICLAIMIAFDAEGIGEMGDFTESHLPASGAAILISNQWIMRSLVAPRLMEHFNISEDMEDVFTFTHTEMSLQHPINLDHLNDRSLVDHISLNSMTMTFSAGQIDITGSVNVTGTGFSGSGSISGRAVITTLDGSISTRIELDEPEIEIRAEWWVHLLHVVGLIVLPIVGTIIASIIHHAIRRIEDSLAQFDEEGFLELPIEIGSIELDDLLLSGEYIPPPMPEPQYGVSIAGDMKVTDYSITSSRSISSAGVSAIIVDHGLTYEGDFEARTYFLCYPLDNIRWSLAGSHLVGDGSVNIDETAVEFAVNGMSCKLKTENGASLNTELAISVIDHLGNSAFDAINLKVEGKRTLFSATGVELLEGPSAINLFCFERMANEIDFASLNIYDDPRVSESYSQSYISLVNMVVSALNVGADQRINCKDFRPH